MLSLVQLEVPFDVISRRFQTVFVSILSLVQVEVPFDPFGEQALDAYLCFGIVEIPFSSLHCSSLRACLLGIAVPRRPWTRSAARPWKSAERFLNQVQVDPSIAVHTEIGCL